MTDYIVANCETAAFNGTYIQVYPSYWEKSDGGYIYSLYYEGNFGCMMLQGGDGSEIYIDNNYGGELPPDDPSIDWYSLFTGTPSALTVTAASSGTTHEGEATISSLSYLRSLKYRTPWWLAGGIAAANCVAAYQPKGAASYAASLVNLANPGTYDAYAGVAPTFDTNYGWKGNKVNAYLLTGIAIDDENSYTIVVRSTAGGLASDGDRHGLFGTGVSGQNYDLTASFTYGGFKVGSSSSLQAYGNVYMEGVSGARGLDAFCSRDGFTITGSQTAGKTVSGELAFLRGEYYTTLRYTNYYISAAVIYSTLLSDAILTELIVAMAAL